MTRKVHTIVIHESDTPTGRETTAHDIDQWHRARGWFRSEVHRKAYNPTLTSIGYHYVIRIDGTVETGRHPDEIGAHVAGHNADSIGICLVGCGQYTPAQWDTLADLVNNLIGTYGLNTGVCGHRDFPGVTKTCPDFDVAQWIAGSCVAPADHTVGGVA